MPGEYYKDKPSHDAAIWRMLEAERGCFDDDKNQAKTQRFCFEAAFGLARHFAA